MRLSLMAVPTLCAACVLQWPADMCHGQKVEWLRQSGSSSFETNLDVATDGFGNAYVVGEASQDPGGTIDALYDVVIRKYGAEGSLQWTRQLETLSTDHGHGIAADRLGNVFVAGYTGGDLEGSSAGATDVFLSRFDALGNRLWTKQVGTEVHESAMSVALDGLGNVYIAGMADGDLPSDPLDAFVSKFDFDGMLQWTQQIGTAEWDNALGVSADTLGNVYVTGNTRGPVGGVTFGDVDAFLTRLNSNGEIQWSKQFGTSRYDLSTGVAVDGEGGAYIAGVTEGNLGGLLAGFNDAFVSKFDAVGGLEWTRQFGSSDIDGVWAISTDAFGNVLLAGSTGGSLDGLNAGSSDAFVRKYLANGVLDWGTQVGTSQFERPEGIAADELGNLFVAGHTEGNLGGINSGLQDAFVVKFRIVPEPSAAMQATIAMMALLPWFRTRRLSLVVTRSPDRATAPTDGLQFSTR